MKGKNILTVCLLAAFLAGFGLWSALRTPDGVSQAERRPLAQRPEFTVSGFLSGRFADELDDFAADQFPLREQLRTLRSLVSYDLLGQRDVNGVYLSQGYAAKLDFPLNTASVDRAADRFRYVYDTYLSGTDVSVYLSVIPDKGYFLAPSSGRPSMDYDALAARLREHTPYMTYIDLFGSLTLEDYYRTDAHWRQERLMDVARQAAAAMGTDAAADYRQVTLDRPFYGVYSGYAALPLAGESLSYLTNDTIDACRVTNYETGKTGPVYDLDKAAGNDPYELFLSGSVSLLTVENPNARTDRELVIFRDSFASSLAPLLLEGYSRVTLVDIRYLSPSQLGNYLTFDRQDVWFLYSTSVLNNSSTLK